VASSPIEINVLLNSRGVLDGSEDAERALKDLEGAVEKLNDTAARDLDIFSREFDDVYDAARKVEDEMRDVQRATERAGDAGRDAGDDMRDGMRRAEEGAQEFKDEANSTAREAAASFDGSAESIADAFQEVAANAFAGFGPAGAIAGLAAAAGIGMAVAGFEDVQKAQEESEQRAADWADAFIRAGGRIIDSAELVAGVQEIATDPERYKEAETNAENWGITVGTAMRAMAGDATALEVAERALGEKQAELNAFMAEGGFQADEARGDMGRLRQEVLDGEKAWEQLTGEMDAGAERARNVSDALLGIIDSASGATIQVDELGNKVYTLPDGKQIMIDARTGQATDNLDGFKGDLDDIPAEKAVVVKGTVQLDTSAYDQWTPTVKTARVKVVGGPTYVDLR
jgi:uncharacterized protein YukE